MSIGYQLLYAYDVETKRRFETEAVYANDLETNISFQLSLHLDKIQ